MFSIIIPLYNSSDVLPQLIDTLKNQSCKDFEVIFIDDSSSDNTINVFEGLKKNIDFSYIILTNDSNKGPGISRNYCLKKVTKQYVLFLDADDRIAKDTIKLLKQTIIEQKNPDAVIFDYYMIFNKNKVKCNTVLNSNEGFITPENAILYASGATWCKVYKMDIIQKFKIRFPEMRTKEDFVFNKIALSYCKTIFYYKQNLYEYIINSTSVMNTTKLTGEYNAKKAFDILDDCINIKYKSTLTMLKTKEYLFASVQSMVRMGLTSKQILNFINEYDRKNTNWYDCISQYRSDLYVSTILRLIKARKIHIVMAMIHIKDFIKKHITK